MDAGTFENHVDNTPVHSAVLGTWYQDAQGHELFFQLFCVLHVDQLYGAFICHGFAVQTNQSGSELATVQQCWALGIVQVQLL